MGYIKPLSIVFVKKVELTSILSYLEKFLCFSSMLYDTLQTRENRFFSWSAGYIIQVILIIQEQTDENILF
ncbi:hypothetical protein HMPREF2987_09215 [Streptococcus sp. HMSC067H01]|nr:hypothetical protein HMPREF2987_09215 [Streptococcus sp. HMSC067H01]